MFGIKTRRLEKQLKHCQFELECLRMQNDLLKEDLCRKQLELLTESAENAKFQNKILNRVRA